MKNETKKEIVSVTLMFLMLAVLIGFAYTLVYYPVIDVALVSLVIFYTPIKNFCLWVYFGIVRILDQLRGK